MGTPQRKTPKVNHRRQVNCVVKLCILVIGLPLLFTILLNLSGGLVAGLLTLIVGVFASVVFTHKVHEVVPESELQVEPV